LKPLIASPTDKPDSELPDWLKDSGQDNGPSLGEQTEADDWLARIRADGDSDSGESTDPFDESPTSLEEEGDEDWLQRIRDLNEDKDEDTDTVSEEDEFPDWMMGPNEEDTPPETESTPEGVFATPQETEADVPDWLKAPPDDVPSDEAEEDEFPDWMTSHAEDETPSETESTPEEDDFDWSRALGKPHDEVTSTDETEDEIPDWMTGISDDEIAPMAEPEAEIETAQSNFDEEEEPDWLQKIGADAPADLMPSGDAAPISPFVAGDLDDDLFDADDLSELFVGEDDDLEVQQEAGEEGDELAPAELPSWLQAMRPIDAAESSIPDEGEIGPTVKTGPLSGLRGVLLAEPKIAQLQAPPTFSAKLQIPKTQQDHVKLLEELLRSEGEPQPIPKPPIASSQRLLRWLIALILCLVVGFIVVSGDQQAYVPAQKILPFEVLDANDLIDELSSKSPVLVSFDYEPGTAGEMEAAAAAVIDHLMLKGAYITLVSTSPTGPALAEHFITTVQAEHKYVSGRQYINLGYIPGGASGLMGFAKVPQRITPISFDGFEAWSTAPLEKVNSLSDFELAIVITDNPDVARTWIEQIQPGLKHTPFVIVASAQAEPVLYPYYGREKAQVNGLVSGIIGGAAYEQITGKPNLASTYWQALNYGLMTMIATIVIGGVVNAIITLIKKNKGEAS
ncbi:MAG: hypothetical protein U9Q82_02430, partial [Chloroflexota bacterium]|nr:hypothetical protein [Chloroflexota bacterium]